MPARTEQTRIEKVKSYINRQRYFVNGCTKPKADEWKKLAFATATGIVVMGMAAYVIKAISYPIFTKFGGMNSIIEQ